MRTTLNIDDELLAWVRKESRRSGRSLGEVVDEAIRLRILRPSLSDATGPEIPVHTEGEFLPGVDPTSNRSMAEAMDAG